MCLGNRAESAYLSHCRLSMCDGGSCQGHRGINCWWVAPVHRSGGSQNPDRWLKELRNNQLKSDSIKRCNKHAKRYLQKRRRHATINSQKHISSFQCQALSDSHIISDILCFSFYFNSFKKSRRWRYDKELDHSEAVYTNGFPADKRRSSHWQRRNNQISLTIRIRNHRQQHISQHSRQQIENTMTPYSECYFRIRRICWHCTTQSPVKPTLIRKPCRS